MKSNSTKVDSMNRERWSLEAIKAKCEVVGACWVWTKGITGSGAPVQREGDQMVNVARRVFALANGRPMEAASFASKRCNDKRCVSPACIYERTRGEAMSAATRVYKNPSQFARQRRAHAIAQGWAKLDLDKAREIRSRVASGEKRRDIAADFGVSMGTISRVVTQKRWPEAGNSVFTMRPTC